MQTNVRVSGMRERDTDKSENSMNVVVMSAYQQVNGDSLSVFYGDKPRTLLLDILGC